MRKILFALVAGGAALGLSGVAAEAAAPSGRAVTSKARIVIAGAGAAGLGQFGQFLGQAGAVNGVDGVEQFDGNLGLVGLQRANHMHLHRAKAVAQIGPFGLRLLHIVFAKDPVAGGQHLFNAVQRLHLGHSDQRDRGFVPSRGGTGPRDARPDLFKRHVLSPFCPGVMP